MCCVAPTRSQDAKYALWLYPCSRAAAASVSTAATVPSPASDAKGPPAASPSAASRPPSGQSSGQSAGQGCASLCELDVLFALSGAALVKSAPPPASWYAQAQAQAGHGQAGNARAVTALESSMAAVRWVTVDSALAACAVRGDAPVTVQCLSLDPSKRALWQTEPLTITGGVHRFAKETLLTKELVAALSGLKMAALATATAPPPVPVK
jgi:hypothetical protein